MGCCQRLLAILAKFALILFNVGIMLLGVFLIVFGTIILNETSKLSSNNLSTDTSVGGFAVALGTLIILVAILGCYATIKQSNCLLNTYYVIMIILFALQLILTVLAFVAIRDDEYTGNPASKVLRIHFEDAKRNNTQSMERMNVIQKFYKCCGMLSYHDWAPLPAPDSCLSEQGVKFVHGCQSSVTKEIDKHIKMVGMVTLIFVIVEIAIALVAYLIMRKRNKPEA